MEQPPPREHCISRMPTYRPNDLSNRFNPSPPPSAVSVSPTALRDLRALQALHRLPVALTPVRPLAHPPHSSSTRCESDSRIIAGTFGETGNHQHDRDRAHHRHHHPAPPPHPPPPPTHLHMRTHSHIVPVTPNRPRLLPRALSFPVPTASSSPSSPARGAAHVAAEYPEYPEYPEYLEYHDSSPKPPLGPDVDAGKRISTAAKQTKARVLRRNNGLEKQYPPPAMITQGSYRLEIDTTSTTDWVASQQIAPSPSTGTSRTQPPQSPAQPLSARSFESGGSRPLIKPIRGFKPSSRKSTEMAMRRPSGETDNTLRALEGYDRPRRISDPSSQEEPASDDSDMFLRAAKEEELSRRASNAPFGALARSNSKGSRGAAQRSSLPPSSTLFQSSISHRRGSDHDSSSIRGIDDQGNGNVGQVLTYRPEKDRTSTALGDVNRNRFYGSTTRSPTTPRGLTSREPSIESTAYQGRRGSLPDPSSVLPSRPSSYRQSNLSYSTPRNYNSSPLVSRATDMQEAPAPETIRAAEGTESTVSTTAPSTVWDELEDLKSRIHRLELTGKLPPTSGAAMSRASHDRPPTATTTVTTMSTSPKQRGSGNSVSPVEAINKQVPPSELHPLLHAALAKSKPLLAPEVFSTLEATASDALAIASMMGTSGQPGPMSSAQSTIDRPTSTVSDRQVRRKADSMCRSLTELCIALSYGKTEHASSTDSQTAVGPRSRDTEVRPSIEQGNVPRLPMGNELARIKASPRALSRLEARRSSLLNTTTLPSPRYAPSETGTPTQTSMAGRRTSLYIRSRRANTEEPEEQDETRFRVPSRAITEIGRFKNTQREYLEEPLPEKTTTVQSALPVRRQGHIATSSLPNAAQSTTTAQSSIGGRRYLDRGTPERDTTGPIGRLVEERGPPKPSIGQGFGLGRAGSLNRRKREQTNSVDYSSASQNYQ